MQSKEVTNLAGGLNLRAESADLRPQDAAVLVNLEPSRVIGSLVVRRGRSDLGSFTLSDTLIRTVAKVDGARYQVAGRRVYRAGTAITLANTLSSNLETTILPFRPLQDSEIWAFVADEGAMFKDDGTNTYRWGLEEPSDPVPKLSNQSGADADDPSDNGTIQIAVTQIRYDDDLVAHEGNPATNSFTIEGGTNLSDPIRTITPPGLQNPDHLAFLLDT